MAKDHPYSAHSGAPDPTASRVSMSDVARVARVHRSTVSLALRHQSKIPAVTRDKILRVAASLGYRPDPLLDAFNFHRVATLPIRGTAGIAFVSDCPSREAFEASALHRESFVGANEQAHKMGFSLDLFLTGPRQLSAMRLDRVLQSRGIFCMIIGAISRATSTLPLDWSRYCVVALDSFHLQPAIDSITLDYRTATRNAVRRLRALGHSRIGFVSTADEDDRLHHLPFSGFLFEVGRDRPLAIPPLLLPASVESLAQSQFLAWRQRFRPTAIVAGCRLTSEAVRQGRLSAPIETIWTGATESTASDGPSRPQMKYRDLGMRAAELLPLRRLTNLCGVPAHRSVIVLPEDPEGALSLTK